MITSGHLLNLVFLLVYTAFANGGVELYITPSVDSSCPQDPCLTLSQFAADPSNYTGNETNINHRWVQYGLPQLHVVRK